MTTFTDHNDKVATTLKSLSFEPVADAPRHAKRLPKLALATSAGIIAMTAGFFTFHEDLARLLPLQSPVSGPSDVSATANSASLVTSRTLADQRLDEPAPRQTGTLAPREITGSGFVVTPRITNVFSKYEGRIIDIAVEPGDQVAKGQILVKLEDASARFALEQAQADKIDADLLLAGAVIDLKQAQTSLARIEILAKRDAASKQRLDETRTAANSAANSVKQAHQKIADAELAIRIAKERLAELVIRAPFAGTVTHLNAHIGDTVLDRADSVRDSQSLLTLADTQHMMIDADVAETNIASLHAGLHGEAVLDGFPDHPFALEVARLSPVISREKGTITLRLAFTDPPKGIRPNMAARIRLLLPPSRPSQPSRQQHDLTADITAQPGDATQ